MVPNSTPPPLSSRLPLLLSPEVLRSGVVKKQEVHAVHVEELPLVVRADVLEETGRHAAVSPGVLA